MSPEKRLIKMLLERYRYVGDQGRPVLDLSTAVPVKFGLGLIQMALDEKKEMLTLNTWTRYVSDQVCSIKYRHGYILPFLCCEHTF